VNARTRPLYLFALLLLLFPAIGVLVQACERGLQSLDGWQWGLLVALPALAWIWLRHFSVLACLNSCQTDGRTVRQDRDGMRDSRPADAGPGEA
jgi:hypothetical protein